MRYKKGVKGGKINPFGNVVVLDSVEELRILLKNIELHEATINQELEHMIKFQKKGGYKGILKIMLKRKRLLIKDEIKIVCEDLYEIRIIIK